MENMNITEAIAKTKESYGNALEKLAGGEEKPKEDDDNSSPSDSK